ncbi:hypothetical protein DFAR_1720007 [Desulfarculales bacterium]
MMTAVERMMAQERRAEVQGRVESTRLAVVFWIARCPIGVETSTWLRRDLVQMSGGEGMKIYKVMLVDNEGRSLDRGAWA